MKTYTVYRVEFLTDEKKPIGKVVDRRRKERTNNIGDMLRLAQKLYGTPSLDSRITINPE